ncbi:MAG TPA: efflux RND transporter periplasmic adaptor subunit [Haliangiales bacterium]|nr:efflux RND transporter periplasmic adaptor subunit [Haliangiales bacterium]
MSVFRWIFAAAVVALVGMIAMKGLAPKAEPPVPVQIAKAQKATITRTVSAAGKLEPVDKVNVSSNITGILVDLQVAIGSVVKKGQYLGQIDTSRYKAQLDQQRAQTDAAVADIRRAAANLAKLKAEEERQQALVAKGAGNKSDYENAHAAVQIAQAELSQSQSRADVARGALSEAQSSFTWATLKAPIDGTVLATNHRVGERIRGSDFSEDVVLVIGTLDRVNVRIEIGEHDVVFVKPGQLATVEVDALPDVPIKGTVIDSGRDAIVKNAGTENEITTFPVWVHLDHPPPQVLSGMSAQVSISTETKRDVVGVPIQAVTVRASGAPPGPSPEGLRAPMPPPPSAPVGSPKSKLDKVVFVVRDGKVEKRKVVAGLSSESMVEIVDGLKEGEEVVEGPYRTLARQLEDGTKVVKAPPGGGGPGGGQQMMGRQ